jgi:hypothetical protein
MLDVRCFRLVGAFLLLLVLALNVRGAGPVVLSPRVITLPASAGMPRFADVDGDGRADLLVIDVGEKTLLNYHQRPGGFAGAPDQVIPLPPQTLWVAPCDVDAHPGLELLMSTAAGLVYSRQEAGLFESEWRPLIQGRQVFTNFDYPILTLLTTNNAGTNDLIPVISARQALPYHRNSAYEWSPGPPLSLKAEKAGWSVSLEPWDSPWALGPNPAHRLSAHQSFRARPDQRRDQEPENEAIRKLIEEMKKTGKGQVPQIERMDVDGDGREDLVLWQLTGNLGFKTDICIFLSTLRSTATEDGRGANGQLPEQPTQVLRCRGFPIPLGSTRQWSPLHDLNGDGICELVLLEFKPDILSANGVVETFLSHGIDWVLTIRTFHGGTFSGSPDASVQVKGILPAEVLGGWTFFIDGDFNGDGRLDFLVRRTETQWNIYFSTTDGRWFAPHPEMTFDAPAKGYMEIKDLNGDGLSDVIWREPDEHRLSIFMSPARQATGGKP